MKNEKLMYSIGNIEDKYIIEAKPETAKAVKLFRKPLILAAAIAAFMLLCAFTVYVLVSDYWIQKPSKDPIKTVRSAIENQIKKDYGLRVEVESIEIDESETARVIENYISGEIARRRGWSDEYLAEHFIAIRAIYYVEYDHTKTFLDDGNVTQWFYLTRDIKTGKWTIVDNSGNVAGSDDLARDDMVDIDASGEPGLESGAAISVQEQIAQYLSEIYTKAYAPYYDGLHYKMTDYKETIVDGECTATFLWTRYNLGKAWDVQSDLGVEQESNIHLQATATLINDVELDLSTISILADVSMVGPPDYRIPVEEYFPNQLAD